MLQKSNKILCQVCFKALTSHGSIVAGMGPVCRERLRFAEQADTEVLETMKGELEVPNSRSLLPFRNIILKEKASDKIILSSLLGVNNGSIILVDRQKLNQIYNSSDSISYTQAFSQSLGVIQNFEIESVHAIEKPDHPEYRRDFIKFSKVHKTRIEERESISSKNLEASLDYSFGNVTSTRDLSEDQKKNREEMMNLQKNNNEKFNQLFATAEFHLATFLKRLETSSFSEILEVRKILLKRYTPQIDVKDYGLTQNEIANGLQSANKNIEKNLYRAFSEGNTNLMAIVDIFNKQDKLEPKDKIFAIKVINTLIQDKYMSQGHKDTAFYEQIRNFLKIHNISNCHGNWKK